jgi:hypothetical protein
MYCVGVGPGGGPNRYPALPQGAKIAFVTPPYAPNFASSFTGDAGSHGAAHAAADALCAAQAAGAGVPGTFRAFVSTTAASAVQYFAAYGMDGPWYRSDGLAIAANSAALFGSTLVGSSPIGAQIALLPSGQFAADLTEAVMTGVGAGGVRGTTNCQDFTSANSSVQTVGGRVARRDSWAIDSTVTCDTAMALYCFEQ